LKRHIVVTLAKALPNDALIPDWITFINDKSVVLDTFTPAIDRLMQELGLRFWLTKEYSAAAEAADT
jgi:hypothetical protein